jgi:hypothetical protein
VGATLFSNSKRSFPADAVNDWKATTVASQIISAFESPAVASYPLRQQFSLSAYQFSACDLPIHHAQVKSSAANIQPALNHDSRMRLEAMMISPAVVPRL